MELNIHSYKYIKMTLREEFREYLNQEKKKLKDLKHLISLNEIFNYISDYKEVSGIEYTKYREHISKLTDKTFYKMVNDFEEKRKKEHGPRVHYYKYKDFLIYYGKFKYSNKFEIHFLDITNPDTNVINGKGYYSSIFSVIMSILKDKHFDKGKSENIYIVNKTAEKIDFYEVVIKGIMKKYNIQDWYVHKDRRGLVISKDDTIITEADNLVSKTLLTQEDKDLLDRLDKNNNYI